MTARAFYPSAVILARIKDEWGNGDLSISQIAQFAGTTKNTIIGLAHRVDAWPPRASRHYPKGEVHRPSKPRGGPTLFSRLDALHARMDALQKEGRLLGRKKYIQAVK